MTAKEKLVLFASNMLPLMPHTFDRFVSLLDAALSEARAEGEHIGAERQMKAECEVVRAATKVVLQTGDELAKRMRQAFAEQNKGTEADNGGERIG